MIRGNLRPKKGGDVSLFLKLMGPRLLYQQIAIFLYFIAFFVMRTPKLWIELVSQTDLNSYLIEENRLKSV